MKAKRKFTTKTVEIVKTEVQNIANGFDIHVTDDEMRALRYLFGSLNLGLNPSVKDERLPNMNEDLLKIRDGLERALGSAGVTYPLSKYTLRGTKT